MRCPGARTADRGIVFFPRLNPREMPRAEQPWQGELRNFVVVTASRNVHNGCVSSQSLNP
jgi:hypothetical protein